MPRQTTTGPTPPPDIEPKIREEVIALEGAAKVISVPGYKWRHGCSPTALGMVIGYHDGQGYDDLVLGDASTQTSAVNQAIASQGNASNPRHYEDYSLPIDKPPGPIKPDKSEPPEGDEHPHDCIADFIRTSWSSISNRYGWSFGGDIGPAFSSYVNFRNPYYGPSYQEYSMLDGTLNWEILTREINNGRPMVFGVDTSAGMHSVTVVGYRDTPAQQYGCLDTWDPANVVRWCDFKVASGQSWGVYNGYSFSLAPIRQMHVKKDEMYVPDETGIYDFGRVELGFTRPVTFTIENDGATDLNLTGYPIVDITGDNADDFVVTQQPSTPVPSGGSVTFEITFGPSSQGRCDATVSINNDESDKGPYNFTITGAGGLVPLTIYVDDDASNDPGSGTKEDPYRRIQDAVDAAIDGDEVVVADGTYTGDGNVDIDFDAKAITVRSRDPNNANIVAATIIDCNGTETDPHRGFYFHNNEDANSSISGLTIANGYANDGAGIYCDNSSPSIRNCNFIDGSAENWGGGIYCYRSSAVISNCTFTRNSADEGAAITLYSSGHPVIDNCFITGNTASISGGGINSDCGTTPAISNCTITGNFAGSYGGGGISIYQSNPTITNCIIAGNSSDNSGGGILHFYEFGNGSTITNCTIVANSAANYGGGVHGDRRCKMTVTNSILWDNVGDQPGGVVFGTEITFTHCDIQGSGGSENWKWHFAINGGGNIDENPLFTSSDDYHLMPYSPCIDTGTNTPTGGLPTTDIDGKPRPLDGDNDGIAVADMGAYEWSLTGPIIALTSTQFTFYYRVDDPYPDTQVLSIWNDGIGTLNWQIVEDCNWLEVRPSKGESTGEVNDVVLSVDTNGLSDGILHTCRLIVSADEAANGPVPVYVYMWVVKGQLLCVPQDYHTIQDAVNAATDGDAVIVADDVHTGYGNRDINFSNKDGMAIIVASRNGPDNCIIDCNGTEDEPHRGFYFDNCEVANCFVAGFTITNGYGHQEGAAIFCNNASPTIINCAVTANNADHSGGGIYCFRSSPKILNCTIAGNSAEGAGGGIYCEWESSPTITNCTITGNSAKYDGGGGIYCFDSNPTITNCTIAGNSTEFWVGGGINCEWGGNPTITNCTITGNSAKFEGGGIFGGNPTITNCVINANKAMWGGGIAYCGGPITNCTITNNRAEWGGGLISCRGLIANCTITNNRAKREGGGLDSCKGAITNSIIWSNIARDNPQLARSTDPTYSCIQSWPNGGNGNTNVDPLFVNSAGDYHLLPDSPCINTGDPDYIPAPNETDLDGRPRIIGDAVDMGAYEFNHVPIADAGPNQTAYAWIDGIAEVTLDGSDSNDPDGDELTYLWTWTIEPNTYEANSVTPTIELPVGEHTIELIANDGIADSEPNCVTITVMPPVQADMKVTPQVLNLDSRGNWVKAHFVMPDGFSAEQIDTNAPAVFEPPGIESDLINAFINEEGLVKIKIAFDRSSFCAAPMDYGPVEVSVIGSLTTGRYFYGTDIIRIKTHDPRCIAFLASHWLDAGCGAPDWCGAFDLDHNSKVDFADYSIFADYWLH